MTTTTTITTKPVTDALTAIPGYTQAQTVKDRLHAWKVTPPQLLDPATELLAAAENGDTYPADLVVQVVRSRAQAAAANDVHSALVDARQQAAARVAEIRSAGRDHALVFLGDRLDEILHAVRDVDQQLPAGFTVHDLAAADTTTITAWQTLDAAVTDYGTLRRIQFELYEGLEPPLLSFDHGVATSIASWDPRSRRRWYARCGLTRDHLDQHPEWITRRAEAAGAQWRYDTGQARHRWYLGTGWLDPQDPTATASDWLGNAKLTQPAELRDAHDRQRRWLLATTQPTWTLTDGSWWPDDNRHDYLRWLATNARPWVPTGEQLRQAEHTAALAITRPAQRTDTASALTRAADALTQHRNLTGTTTRKEARRA